MLLQPSSSILQTKTSTITTTKQTLLMIPYSTRMLGAKTLSLHLRPQVGECSSWVTLPDMVYMQWNLSFK